MARPAMNAFVAPQVPFVLAASAARFRLPPLGFRGRGEQRHQCCRAFRWKHALAELEGCVAALAQRKFRTPMYCTSNGAFSYDAGHFLDRVLLVVRNFRPSFARRTALLRVLPCVTRERGFAAFYVHRPGNCFLFSARIDRRKALPAMRHCLLRIRLGLTLSDIHFWRILLSRNFDSSKLATAFAKLVTEKGPAPYRARMG